MGGYHNRQPKFWHSSFIRLCSDSDRGCIYWFICINVFIYQTNFWWERSCQNHDRKIWDYHIRKKIYIFLQGQPTVLLVKVGDQELSQDREASLKAGLEEILRSRVILHLSLKTMILVVMVVTRERYYRYNSRVGGTFLLNRVLSPSVLDPKSQSRNHKSNRVLCTKSNRVRVSSTLMPRYVQLQSMTCNTTIDDQEMSYGQTV